jgi:glycosyltransferase involved in cell wall biosynthesis
MELLRSLPDGASCLVLGAPLHREYTADVLETGRRAGVTIDLGPTDADLAAGLRSAQWCVCPTQAALGGKELRHPELLGLTAIEAYLAGTRAVLSDVPAFAELAPLLGAVLYSSHEHRALAKQLMACISSPSEWTAMEPPEFFTWHSVAERARDFFQMILGSGGSEGKGLLA